MAATLTFEIKDPHLDLSGPEEYQNLTSDTVIAGGALGGGAVGGGVVGGGALEEGAIGGGAIGGGAIPDLGDGDRLSMSSFVEFFQVEGELPEDGNILSEAAKCFASDDWTGTLDVLSDATYDPGDWLAPATCSVVLFSAEAICA